MAEDKAAFGVFPQLKAKRSKQDAQAAKNVPVDLARGALSGVLGAPGDIESLIRLLPGLSNQTILPTSEDIEKRLPLRSDTPVSRAATGLGQLGGGFYTGPGAPVRAIGALPAAIKHGAGEFVQAAGVPSTRVIKPKGGNWLEKNEYGERMPLQSQIDKLKGSVGYTSPTAKPALEAELAKYKASGHPELAREVEAELEALKQKEAIQNWVDINLQNYVKKEMATPEDPVRLYAEARNKEIADKFEKDIERADRMAERAAAEPDPRRQGNMARQAQTMREEAESERNLAMKHIFHSPDIEEFGRTDVGGLTKKERREAGFPEEGMAQSEPAKRWENLTDEAIKTFKAADLQKAPAEVKAYKANEQELTKFNNKLNRDFHDYLYNQGMNAAEISALQKTPVKQKIGILYPDKMPEYESILAKRDVGYSTRDYGLQFENPWANKLAPETTLYTAAPHDLGFEHIVDVLKQDVAAGRIRPEQLGKISMEQAIRRTTEFDMDMAKKMREAQIKNQEGFPVHKEYPEGYKWMELALPKMPEELPQGWEFKGQKGNAFVAHYPDPDHYGGKRVVLGSDMPDLIKNIYKRHPDTPGNPSSALEQALKYEGETMGHCVGGYCPDVVEGRSRIYSLRDKKGEPHVTVEVQPNKSLDYNKWYEQQPTSFKALINAKKTEPGYDRYQEPAYLAAIEAQPPIIKQIKGKGNAAPKEDYLPYVQDFVRGGQWSDVGDIHNTGMRSTKSVFNETELAKLREAGEANIPHILGGEDIQRLHNLIVPEGRRLKYDLRGNIIGSEEGLKAGGAVHMTDNTDAMQMELDNQHFQAGGIAKLLKGAAKAAEAPSIIIPSKISELKEAVRQSKGDFGARRVERAADEIPNLEKLYREEALRQAFTGDNAKALMTMNPKDFEKFAHPLTPREKPWPGSGPKKENLPTDEYIKYLSQVDQFHDVPFLEINKQEQGLPLTPFISGHEGRHRNRALAERGESAGLVQLFPRAELREPFPRRSQEEYLEALRNELEMTGDLVLPEKYTVPSDSVFDKQIQRPAIALPKIYKEGGAVNFTDNTDAMRMELDQHMAGGGLTKAAREAFAKIAPVKEEIAAKAAQEAKYKQAMSGVPLQDMKSFEEWKATQANATPEELERMRKEMGFAGGGLAEKLARLMRAPAKSKAEIEAIAERMAPQVTGEFVRGEKGTQSVAGKTQKQFAREKEIQHDIRPTGAEPPKVPKLDYEKLKDNVVIGIAGDPTITGKSVHAVAGQPLQSPSPQHGGPMYGLGHDKDHFWASQLGAARKVQNLSKQAGEQYDLPVLGKYIMMGPESINYAQHFADANLSAINPAKMTKSQIEGFNKLIREGSQASGPRPSFPGIENPEEAYLYFSVDPESRKHFNALMQMPTVTERFNLPSGIDIRHAVTEPELSNLETGVTGFSVGRMRPDVPATSLKLSEHPTYSHDIPGEFMGQTQYPIPYELSFPDTLKAIRENPKQAPHEFGSLKMVGPRQVIDQQMIDEIKRYEETMKKLTGKKKGGAVTTASGLIEVKRKKRK